MKVSSFLRKTFFPGIKIYMSEQWTGQCLAKQIEVAVEPFVALSIAHSQIRIVRKFVEQE